MRQITHPMDKEETLNYIYNLTHPRPSYPLTPIHHERDQNMLEYKFDMKNPTVWTRMYRQFLKDKSKPRW